MTSPLQGCACVCVCMCVCVDNNIIHNELMCVHPRACHRCVNVCFVCVRVQDKCVLTTVHNY